MTIIETVKRMLTTMPGNKVFDLGTITYSNPNELIPNVAQVSRALRDLPNVKRVGRSRYMVKGRKVPAAPIKPIVAQIKPQPSTYAVLAGIQAIADTATILRKNGEVIAVIRDVNIEMTSDILQSVDLNWAD